MRSKQYILYFLMVVGLIMPAASVIPHHHHGDDIVCMKDDVGTESPRPHHHDDDPCCTGGCVMHPESPAPASPARIPQPGFVHIITLFAEPLPRFVTQPGEEVVRRDNVYLESLHGIFITCAAGLRAPPASFTA